MVCFFSSYSWSPSSYLALCEFDFRIVFNFLMPSTTMGTWTIRIENLAVFGFFLSWAHKQKTNQIKDIRKKEPTEQVSGEGLTKQMLTINKRATSKKKKTMKIKFKLTLVHIKNYYFRILLPDADWPDIVAVFALHRMGKMPRKNWI